MADDIEAIFTWEESKRLCYLEDLIQTRKRELDYFKQVYAHATFWLNTMPIVEFPHSDLCSYFYLLGLSLGKLIHKPDPVILARGGVQLLEDRAKALQTTNLYHSDEELQFSLN